MQAEPHRRIPAVLLLLLLLWASPAAAQQQLGHKLLGTIGLDAGTQPPTGAYVADRLVYYGSRRLADRNGDRIPVDFAIDAFSNMVGASLTLAVPPLATYVNAAFGVPVAYVAVDLGRLRAGVDRFGLGDIYVQPLRLGWRVPHADIVAGYAFYVPTGRFELGGRDGSVSRGYWTHQFAAGGTAYFDASRLYRLSVLWSYELNQRFRGLDITRGDTVQLQGGAGAHLLGLLDAGLVGYASWQVRDDRGGDLPTALGGASDRAFGLGVELGVAVRPIRSRVVVRWAHDVWVTSRPLGQIVLLGITATVWDGGAG